MNENLDNSSEKREFRTVLDELDRALYAVDMSEQKFQAMAKNIPGALVVFETESTSFRIKYMSDGCENITGYTAKELINKSASDLLMSIHPRFRDMMLNHNWLDINANKDKSFLFQLLRKDATYACLKLKLTTIESGEKLVYYGVLTRDKDKEENERQFQHFITRMYEEHDENLISCGRYNISTNEVVYFDRKVDWSIDVKIGQNYDYALSQMVLIAASQEEGKRIHERLNIERLEADFIEGDVEGRIEFKRRSDDGKNVWTLKKYNMYKEPFSGDLLLFLYSYNITDIMFQKQIISKLGEKEYESLGIIDVLTHEYESRIINGITTTELPGDKYLNDNFESMISNIVKFGVPQNEQADLLQALNIDMVIANLENKERYSVSFTVKKESGECLIKNVCFCYIDDTKTTIFCYSTDITDEYNKEQEYIRKLEEALAEAEYATKSKNNFYSRMSHDMRTPLNAIIGLSELYKDETDTSVLSDNMKKICEASKYLRGIINDTLDIQKIENGKLILEPEVVNCVDIMNSVSEIVKTLLEKKRIELVVNSNDEIDNVHVVVDQLRMKQIFINLISNAIKFTPDGGVVLVEFGCIKRKGKIAHEKFIVKDTGIGMSEDFLKNGIFKPFAQEHNKLSDRYASTGLGLSIVKSLVEMMGGTISVESKLNEGTTFTLIMDIECVDIEDVNEKEKENEIKRNETGIYMNGRKILMAEDKKINAIVAEAYLEKVKCEVVWARDGKECLDLFNESDLYSFDAILMDIRMPIMDGITATKAIRKLEREDALNIPIVALSADAYLNDANTSLNAGMNAYLAKPIEPNKLYCTLSECIHLFHKDRIVT